MQGTKFYRLWCEYNYGQEEYIFSSREGGKRWLWATMTLVGGNRWMTDAGFTDMESMFEEGLAGFEIVTLIQEQ